MSRLSSAFEAPPESGSMLAQLEESVLESPFTAKMAIILSNDDASGSTNTLASVEPLPYIDYHLVYTLIALAGRYDKRELKPFDYLIDARKCYYRSHSYFQVAFVCLQDTRAYGLQLEREHMRLVNLGSGAAKELENNQIALRKNYRALYRCLTEVEIRSKNRERTTKWFSKMKYLFLHTQMSRLIYIGQPTPLILPAAPLQPQVAQTAVAPSDFGSLTNMLNEDMSVEDLLQAAAGMNKDAQQPTDSHYDVS
ncbi:hypothetical protein MMC22_002735 [Lobaria immixta]|nr:hypothetical protein [Lobaria immixta]